MKALLFCAGFFVSLPGLAAFSESETHLLARPDGSRITYYLRPSVKETNQKKPLLLVLQGSQPDSVFDHVMAGRNIPTLESMGLLMIDKPGVVRGSRECSDEYKRTNSLSARLADIAQVLAHLSGLAGWDGEVLLLGGSEGGALAVQATKALPIKKAVLLVTGGGMTLAEAMPSLMRDSMRGATEREIEAEVEKLPGIFEAIKKHPTATDRFFGECDSFRYWSSILWFRPVDLMLETDTKYLLIHGDRDSSHPASSARLTATRFRNIAPERLVYWELPDLDHSLTDSAGKSRMMEILDRAVRWLVYPTES